MSLFWPEVSSKVLGSFFEAVREEVCRSYADYDETEAWQRLNGHPASDKMDDDEFVAMVLRAARQAYFGAYQDGREDAKREMEEWLTTAPVRASMFRKGNILPRIAQA